MVLILKWDTHLKELIGDTVHRLETIVKVVSAMDEESLDTIAKVYELVVEAGVFKASSIKLQKLPRSLKIVNAISILHL